MRVASAAAVCLDIDLVGWTKKWRGNARFVIPFSRRMERIKTLYKFGPPLKGVLSLKLNGYLQHQATSLALKFEEIPIAPIRFPDSDPLTSEKCIHIVATMTNEI